MSAHEPFWTADMVCAIPDDGNRYEVLDGELLVTPAPSWAHQEVLAKLFALIHPYVEHHALGWTLWSPADIQFSFARAVQPDLFVVRDTGDGKPKSWREVRALWLVIEVLSPSTAVADRVKKRPIYQEERVPEYWIVDTDARFIERWTPDDQRPEVVTDALTWRPLSDVPALEVSVRELFQA